MTTTKKASSVNHPSKGILKILFKEILEQITPDDAERLTDVYIKGMEIGFRIRRNSRGNSYKTAFQPFAEPQDAINTAVAQTEAVVAKECSVCGRELTDGKCVFINHKN